MGGVLGNCCGWLREEPPPQPLFAAAEARAALSLPSKSSRESCESCVTLFQF